MAKDGSLVGTTLGDFELRSVLGVGGMAEVYRAHDLVLEREVAVKVLPATLAHDAGYVERFRNEARQVAALNHPHIVPIYTFGDDGAGGLLYHVMPLLRESLRDRLSRVGYLSPEDAAEMVLQVASALEAAHAIGLVHRDVKPENVLLDADGQALLTDFGIARPLEALRQSGVARTLAATGLPVGTPEYMAPEQLRGESTDQRADIYALGALLYELLTGRVPYEAETPYGVAALVISSPLTPPSAHTAQIWPALDRVVTRALAKNPAMRYADAQAFSTALREAMANTGSIRDEVLDEDTVPTLAMAGRAGAGAGVVAGGAGTWRTGAGFGGSVFGSPRRVLAAGLLALLLVGFIGGAVALLFHGGATTVDIPFANGTFLAGGTAQATDTAAASSTSTSAGSPHGATPGSHPSVPPGVPPGASPDATPGATALPTPTNPGDQPTATPPGPGATPTATPAPAGPSMTVSPATTMTLSPVSNFCVGSQQMTNNGANGQTLNWSWQVSPAPPTGSSGMQYSINAYPYPSGISGTPNQSNMAPGQETLWVRMPCNGQTYTVTLNYNGAGSPIVFTMVVK